MPSMVWTCFQKTDAGPKCLLCNDLRKRRDSSTKTMWVHLKLKHHDVYQKLRGTDAPTKPQLKTMESTSSKPVEANLLTQYNQFLISQYMMNPINQLQSASNLSLLQQQSTNGNFFQNVAFNKFVFEMYARLLVPNFPPLPNPKELKQTNGFEVNANWMSNEIMQTCSANNFDMNASLKSCNFSSNI